MQLNFCLFYVWVFWFNELLWSWDHMHGPHCNRKMRLFVFFRIVIFVFHRGCKTPQFCSHKILPFSWNSPKNAICNFFVYDEFLVCPIICINLYTFEVYVFKISAFKLHRIIKLLIPKHGTLINKHPVYRKEAQIWSLCNMSNID